MGHLGLYETTHFLFAINLSYPSTWIHWLCFSHVLPNAALLLNVSRLYTGGIMEWKRTASLFAVSLFLSMHMQLNGG